MTDAGGGDDEEDFGDDWLELDEEDNDEDEEENTADCCFDGDDDELLLGNDVGGNFNSARLRLTPCSTGSNSSERLSEATANILTKLKNKKIRRIG